MSTLLFERLAKSKDKSGLMELSKKGQIIKSPIDALKDPVILEFLNIPESHRLIESKLEEALITHLQNFLLELGRGFAFVARQKRITLNGQHFYPDLIFYHVILKCYIILDLKCNHLTHGDLGKMQMYVNYFDREFLTEGDNPTIGLLLCAEKNDSVVEYTLGEKNKKIFASKYQFHLPTAEELKEFVKRETAELKQLLEKDSEG
jgi:predicted nuclease of restriction endonuclease-like (RecB) superfamily